MSIDWERQRTFHAVLREGSLSGAARALGASQPTVRRRIDELERALGAALFSRSPTGLQPTDRALALAGHAEAMAEASQAFERAASAAPEAPAGIVRVAACPIAAIELLPPSLARLAQLHPKLVVELTVADAAEDSTPHGADIAVTAAPANADGAMLHKSCPLPLGLFAHRDYLELHRAPADAGALREHRLIGHEDKRAAAAVEFAPDGCGFAFRSDSDLARLGAIRAGLGIGLAPVALAARDPALRRLLPDIRHKIELTVACRTDLYGNARVRVIFDALVDGLALHGASAIAQRATPAHWPAI